MGLDCHIECGVARGEYLPICHPVAFTAKIFLISQLGKVLKLCSWIELLEMYYLVLVERQTVLCVIIIFHILNVKQSLLWDPD